MSPELDLGNCICQKMPPVAEAEPGLGTYLGQRGVLAQAAMTNTPYWVVKPQIHFSFISHTCIRHRGVQVPAGSVSGLLMAVFSVWATWRGAEGPEASPSRLLL